MKHHKLCDARGVFYSLMKSVADNCGVKTDKINTSHVKYLSVQWSEASRNDLVTSELQKWSA